jgi:copper chaperone CopZ
MLIILAISVPLYVCATSSVPIAAVLMMKGISPGAALVFLMAGPATNAATISVIGNSMGKKTVFLYLLTIISGALFSGLFIDYFLPREWFTSAISHIHEGHNHDLLPVWLRAISGITIVLLLLNIFIKKLILKIKRRNPVPASNEIIMNDIKVYVRGMTCSHCKMSVETNLKKLDGIDNTSADLNSQVVTISGDNIDLEKVKETIEGIGYKFDGKVA